MVSIILKKPADCTWAEMDAFCQLVSDGGEVDAAAVRGGAARAKMLAFAYMDGTLAGVAALKNPWPGYRSDVFKKAGATCDPASFTYEMGYVSVAAKFEGKGASKALTAALLEGVTAKVYATSAAGKAFMHRTLSRYGFARAGAAYPSASDPEKKLFLFVRD